MVQQKVRLVQFRYGIKSVVSRTIAKQLSLYTRFYKPKAYSARSIADRRLLMDVFYKVVRKSIGRFRQED